MEDVNSRVLTCEWLRYDTVNYAMQQNFVPIVRRIALTNIQVTDLEQAVVRLTTEPAFAVEWTKRVDLIPAGRTVELGPVDLQLEGRFLAGLTERLNGELVLEVLHGGQTVYRDVSPITVLAFDQWGGLGAMPEMVAAFVMPNHPAVQQTLREAAPLLGKWSGSSSFDAYQSRNPNRVRLQAAAIFAALQAHHFTYCVAPASFEEVGQRVRLPDTVFTHRMGNCLDLTLLYAACLEAAGLHPLIVFTKGHAFAGVWLVEETFSECVQDDASLLTKRLAEGVHEICVAESTLLTGTERGGASFEEAEAAAHRKLADTDDFTGFIDLRRARASRIRPLPMRLMTPAGWEIVPQPQDEPMVKVHASAPGAMRVVERPLEVSSIPVTKQKVWERRLLDLSMRNTLLNLRLTRSTIPLLGSGLGELEDALAEGHEFQLLPRPADWDVTERSTELFRSTSKDHPLTALLREEFGQKRLRADANPSELLTKSIHLYRSARLALEENGANTLYLALGLLKWYESAASELPRYAPIVLVPVELVRKTSKSGFVLRIRDEEPQINITLLELLRQDFGLDIGGLDPLPREEKGIDLAGIFTTIRHAVMNMPRWDTLDSAFLGLFSFSRFVMWNDIRNRADDLARSKVVSSLMNGRLGWEPGDSFPDASTLDDKYAPQQLPLPISSDSSQMTAIRAALDGQSFVLHGPPGTGKSQTITNMIAAALADGRTVLFVAEKMAALSVVQNRLAEIGLGPFCLELHSNKSTKKAVLEQLRHTLEAGQTASPEDWQRQADRLAALRGELNGYVTALHRRHASGYSLYDAIVRYGMVRAYPDIVSLDAAIVGGMDRDRYEAWVDAAKELRVAGEACGHPHGHVWRDAAVDSYTPAVKARVEQLLAEQLRQLAAYRTAYEDTGGWVPFPAVSSDEGPSPYELGQLEEIGRLLLDMPMRVPVSLLGADDLEAALSQVELAVRHGQERDEVRTRIVAAYAPGALSFDAAAALDEWRRAELQWMLPKLLKTRKIRSMLRQHALSGSSPDAEEVPSILTAIVQYQQEAATVRQLEAAVAPLLGALWQGGEADWVAVQEACGWIRRLEQTLLRLCPAAADARRARKSYAELLAAGREAFHERCGRSVNAFTTAKAEFDRLETQLAETLLLDWKALDGARGMLSWWDFRQGQLAKWNGHTDLLREWCGWRLVRKRAIQLGLSSLVQAYEVHGLRHEEVVPVFERAWWKALIEFLLSEERSLASFSGRRFEEKIKSFQETIERFEALTRQEIAARLASRVPPLHNQAASSSEAGILLRAIRSGGRGLSLRRLFEQIPNLLSRICPCVLMSPMSVAQYLDPKYALFDLVVFDEASQLPTSEAVGAMARGRNVVVVGDPKQLPPTSFFTNAAGDEEGDAVVPEDLESILDDCLALGMPQEHLLWHYRSRHESLIAFSNRHFYENKLLTFPSPYERKSSVKWHPVDGYYDRGRTKHNRAEAEAVIQEIARRLKHPDPKVAKATIGVVTFNSIQQGLIEDLLDEAYHADAELEARAMQLAEPIFVKNLENVQGDERDVILFSIGYGPDASGKVSLNFGPLNRDGGWRRLNVAVSRARQEMHVFSTLRADHLDVSRTSAQGVGALKSFLEYAEKGVSALRLQADQLSAQTSAGLESQIADALRDKGFRVDLHVGASGYRIDLAVVDPEQPDTYLLAVLCDGEGYRTGRTARDRELLRARMLERLGWRLHRVWSPDWLESPEKELLRIERAIADAVQAKAAVVEETASLRAGREAPASVHAQEGTPASVQAQEETTVQQPAQRTEPPVQSYSSAGVPYQVCVLESVPYDAEEFYSRSHARLIRDQIARVIDEEGPVSRAVLVRRVLQAWGITRSGTRIERQFDDLLSAVKANRTVWHDVEFYWPKAEEPSIYGKFRIAAQENDRRNAEDLPPEEIACAVKEVLFVQVSLPEEDLIRETARLLGYARSGSALEKAVREGLSEAVRRGFAVIEQGRVRGS